MNFSIEKNQEEVLLGVKYPSYRLVPAVSEEESYIPYLHMTQLLLVFRRCNNI